MTKPKQKYYVVWYGHEPGVYDNWDECRKQITGFKGAKHKSYATREAADCAFVQGSESHRPSEALTTVTKSGKTAVARKKPAKAPASAPALPPQVIRRAVAVDAACSGNPGKMEYRGVYLENGRQLFHFGPCHGTNNIGEFLAIVHALALLRQKELDMPVYSDSRNAILWVKAKKCKTTLARNAKTEHLFELIARAEQWLRENDYKTPVLKWDTAHWGEIPADFGRKH